MNVRMNTSAVTPWAELMEGKIYDLPEDMALALIEDRQAEAVADVKGDGRKTKGEGRGAKSEP